MGFGSFHGVRCGLKICLGGLSKGSVEDKGVLSLSGCLGFWLCASLLSALAHSPLCLATPLHHFWCQHCATPNPRGLTITEGVHFVIINIAIDSLLFAFIFHT